MPDLLASYLNQYVCFLGEIGLYSFHHGLVLLIVTYKADNNCYLLIITAEIEMNILQLCVVIVWD